jgi:hypothetical protein
MKFADSTQKVAVFSVEWSIRFGLRQTAESDLPISRHFSHSESTITISDHIPWQILHFLNVVSATGKTDPECPIGLAALSIG